MNFLFGEKIRCGSTTDVLRTSPSEALQEWLERKNIWLC